MKKAKIMLAAVGIFAIVGGALAFKAQRDIFPFFYKTTTLTSVFCTIPAQLNYTTVGLTTTTIPYTTTNATTLCVASVRATL